MTDQAAVQDRSLAMGYGLALIDRIGDHLQKSGRARIDGDEGVIPRFVRRTDQGDSRLTPPQDRSADTLEDGT